MRKIKFEFEFQNEDFFEILNSLDSLLKSKFNTTKTNKYLTIELNNDEEFNNFTSSVSEFFIEIDLVESFFSVFEEHGINEKYFDDLLKNFTDINNYFLSHLHLLTIISLELFFHENDVINIESFILYNMFLAFEELNETIDLFVENDLFKIISILKHLD